jgi:sec-independent protein translocase protein TatB
MGNLGGGEILVLLLVGLLVLGPERLPAAVRQMGKVLHQVRKVTVGFQEELRSAVEDPIVDVKASLDTAGFQEELRSAVEDPIVDVKASLGGETSLRSAPGTGAPKPGSENPQAGPEKSEDQATEPETDGD